MSYSEEEQRKVPTHLCDTQLDLRPRHLHIRPWPSEKFPSKVAKRGASERMTRNLLAGLCRCADGTDVTGSSSAASESATGEGSVSGVLYEVYEVRCCKVRSFISAPTTAAVRMRWAGLESTLCSHSCQPRSAESLEPV